MQKISKKEINSILISILIIVIAAIFYANTYTVVTGEVAIISDFGKVSKVELAGIHFKIPFVQEKVNLETRERTYLFTKPGYFRTFDKVEIDTDNSITVSTKDIQSVNIELTVQISVTDPMMLYKSFRGMHEERFIRPRVREIVQATIAKYTIEEFISKRTEISAIIYNNLKDDFKEYGLSVSNISIVNHDFSDEYEQAIEQKKVAEQAVEKAKAEQEKLAVEAANRVKLAEFKLKEKTLQAEANLVESKSLTPQFLEKMKIEKWDGVLPKVQGDTKTILPESLLK
ncbi:prohibitin family protein [Oceanivirga miroungae]|uniref:Band 7 domain-containing protein n=1 Tax=Oceanivirga miroungae TaxID=1130046 RepID=A0A6I8MAW9_9FUSO|nr:prohibitin family protein [Oceanivirga miroungae]VWL85333.1 hypothetical protein OMES3154_00617 [Oceanivirga miroungae]